jgi:hypothetical protein
LKQGISFFADTLNLLCSPLDTIPAFRFLPPKNFDSIPDSLSLIARDLISVCEHHRVAVDCRLNLNRPLLSRLAFWPVVKPCYLFWHLMNPQCFQEQRMQLPLLINVWNATPTEMMYPRHVSCDVAIPAHW